MKCAAACLSLSLLAACAAPMPAELGIPQAQAGAEHRWLAQLVGTWVTHTEMPAPDGAAEPTAMTMREHVSALGDLWIVSDGEASFGDTSFRSRMTLGYDPARGHFVGTWIDTTQAILWVYEGTLDAKTNTLTLEAEGPSFDDPTRTVRYRDAIRLDAHDRKTMTSSVQQDDGSWLTFMQAEGRRRR